MKAHSKIWTWLLVMGYVSIGSGTAFAQGFKNPRGMGGGAAQNPALGNGFRGNTPNGVVGANPGPASAVGAPPIGTGPTNAPGDINAGGAFGGGSVAANGTLNGAVSNGFSATGGGIANGLGAAGQGNNTPGDGTAGDALLYSGAGGFGGAGAMGGYGGNQFTQDPVTAYATANYMGMSNLLRAQGEYELEESGVLINNERARTRYIDNQQKLFQARQSMKRVGMTTHAEDRGMRQAERARRDEFVATHQPPPLSHENLDPWNGTIQWPTALRAPDFDDLRGSIDDLFRQKARGYDKSVISSKIDNDIHEMHDLLRSQILTVPLHDYSEARKFLDSMAVSVR